jgi:hypothetical protein
MVSPIFLRVGEGSVVDLPELVGTMGNFLGLLREVDSAVAQKKKGNLRWKVTTLQNDPSPLVGVTPMLRPSVTADDTSRRVEEELISNVSSLTERGERNRYLSDAALARVEKIAKTAPKIGASSIYTDAKRDFRLVTAVTAKTLSQVVDMTSVKSRSFGSVVGKLDSISVHRGNEFRVWDEQSNRPVRCTFGAQQEGLAKELLRHRVIVTGMINADRSGRPLSLKVETLNGAELKDLPTIEEMKGLIPNFTGGLTLHDFFEDLD